MSRRRIPSTLALSAFESAARHESFTKAAEELSVTQSAVCRQIAALEDQLGIKLFRRTKRGVTVTEPGQNYARSVRQRLEEMERDAIEVMAHGALVSTLELAIAPTFSTNWLLPRLPSFMEMHPQVLVNLTTRTRPFLFDETTLDAAIYAGEGSWPGTRGELLLPERLVVVGSPRLVGSGEGISPADIAGLPLIQLTTRPHAWRKWFNVHGLQVSNDMAGPRLDLYAMTAKAAMCGIGVALVPRFLVEDDLSRGHLVQLMAPITGDRAYYIVYPAEKAVSPALTAFKAWISEEARKDREAWDSAASR